MHTHFKILATIPYNPVPNAPEIEDVMILSNGEYINATVTGMLLRFIGPNIYGYPIRIKTQICYYARPPREFIPYPEKGESDWVKITPGEASDTSHSRPGSPIDLNWTSIDLPND